MRDCLWQRKRIKIDQTRHTITRFQTKHLCLKEFVSKGIAYYEELNWMLKLLCEFIISFMEKSIKKFEFEVLFLAILRNFEYLFKI